MLVNSYTWPRDSHGLYDYETNVAVRSNFSVNGAGLIYRMGNECFFGTEPAVGSVVLAEVYNDKGIMYLKASDTTTDWSCLWVSVRSLRELNGYKLAQGDYIKIGRMMFRVKQMSTDPNSSEACQFIDKKAHAEVSSSFLCSPSQSRTESVTCRICLADEITEENPLICPCKCSGTMKYIHLMCLREWLKNRLKTRQTGHSISYFFKSLSCELCKEPLPQSVTVKERFIELMSIPRPETPFLLLEDGQRDERTNRGLHMVSMLPNSEIRMGRSQECDVRIEDISVSRNHAVIKMKDRSFCIEDCGSKFGTLILAKRPIILGQGTALTLQINRTLLNITIKQPWRGLKSFLSMLCCSRSSARVVDSEHLYKNDGDDSIYYSDHDASEDNASSELIEEGTLEVHAASHSLVNQSIEQLEEQ